MAAIPIGSWADVETRWNGPELQRQVQANLARGLKAAAIFLTGRVKEATSVPADRGRFRDRYIALFPASPGAAPRKLGGKLRASITHEENAEGTEARVGSNLVYARPLELGVMQKAGQMFPVVDPAAIARIVARRKKRSLTPRIGETEVIWIRRKQAKWIPPHPFLVPTLQRFRGELAGIIGREASA